MQKNWDVATIDIVSYARLLNFSSVRAALSFQSIVGFRTVQQQFQKGLAERISKLVNTS